MFNEKLNYKHWTKIQNTLSKSMHVLNEIRVLLELGRISNYRKINHSQIKQIYGNSAKVLLSYCQD